MKYDFEDKHYETVNHTTINHMSFFVADIIFRGAHAHSDIEVLQVIHGSMHITTKNSEFDLSQGEVALFNSHEFHMCHSNDASPCCALILQIDPVFCCSYFPRITHMHFSYNNISAAVPAERMREMKQICFDIGYNFFGRKIAFEFRCISDVNRLFGYLVSFVPYTIFSDNDYLNQQNTQRRMNRILDYVRRHYQEKLTLTEIAAREDLTPTYLSSFFKKNMKQSFQSYVNDLRFEHALYLIRNTSRKLIDICIDSGFSDTKYLRKMFMNVYHMTPNDFRKKILTEEIPASATDTAQTASEHLYSAEESLQILRRYYHFRCDDGSFVNYIE